MSSLSEEFAEEEHSKALLDLTRQLSHHHNVVGSRRGIDHQRGTCGPDTSWKAFKV